MYPAHGRLATRLHDRFWAPKFYFFAFWDMWRCAKVLQKECVGGRSQLKKSAKVWPSPLGSNCCNKRATFLPSTGPSPARWPKNRPK